MSSSSGKSINSSENVISLEEIDLPEPEDSILKILWKYDMDSYYLVYLDKQISEKMIEDGFWDAGSIINF